MSTTALWSGIFSRPSIEKFNPSITGADPVRQAEVAATERNYMSASENAAYAMVLFERKNAELGDLPKRLRTYSVEASPALLD